MNTWIRVDSGLADHIKVRRLAARLFPPLRSEAGESGVPSWIAVLTVEGLLVNVWSKVADHQDDSVLVERDDDELELWARWRGEAGLFAKAFRELFVTDGRQIDSWEEYQGRLLERRRKDRARKKRPPNRGLSVGTSAGSSAGSSAPIPALQYSTVTVQDVVAATTGAEGDGSVTAFNPVVDLGYISRCVEALNLAMEANPQVRNFRPVLALNQMDAVRWDRDGIPLDLALAVIGDRSTAYRASGNRQISSLAYFDRAVRERWAGLQGARSGSSSDLAQPATMREAILAKRGF